MDTNSAIPRLLMLACLVLTVAARSEEQQPVRFPVFFNQAYTGGPVRITAEASFFNLRVLSASPVEADRPLLVIFDPAFYSTAEVRRRLDGIVSALAAGVPGYPLPRVWLGIAAGDGILIDPRLSGGANPAEVVETAVRLMPDPEAEPADDPGRVIEMAAVLMKKAEAEGGPADCLLVAKDRPFQTAGADYLKLCAERRALEICSRTGAVIHGYLEGEGSLASTCAATGGLVSGREQDAAVILRQVMEARSRQYVLAVHASPAGRACGRFDLVVRAQDQSGKPLDARAPVALWKGPGETPVPEHDRVLDALDWIRRAQASADNGDYGSALLWIDNAVQLDSWNPDALYLGARYSSALRDWTRAEGYVTQAVQFFPVSQQVLLLYGEVLQKTGKAAQALEMIRSLPEESLSRSSGSQLMMARLFSAAGRLTEAAALYRSLPAGGREGSQVQAEYGCLLWRQGNEAAAGERIRSALKTDASNITAILCSADMAAAGGNIHEALDLASNAARIRPEDPDVHVLMGKIRARDLQWESAAESFQNADRLAPGREDVLVLLAEAELQCGQRQSALESMRKALTADPSDPGVWRSISSIYFRAGQFADAAAVLEQAAARVREQAEELFQEAAAFRERTGQYGQAVLDYRAALRSSPRDRAAQLEREWAKHLAYLSLATKSREQQNGGARVDPPDRNNTIVVPGGVSLLCNILGIAPAALNESDAAGRIFSAILESPMIPGKKMTEAQYELSQQYLHYQKLLRHMSKRKLLDSRSAGSEVAGAARREFVFPLARDGAARDRTRAFLSFFGVKYSLVEKDGKSTVVLTVKQDSRHQARLRLLRYMGVDLEGSKSRELRFTLGNEALPSIFPAAVIRDGFLGRPSLGPEALFPRLVAEGRALELYKALENCPSALRAALVGTFSPKELAGFTGVLQTFGRFLRFEKDRLTLPGSAAAWEQLVGVPVSESGEFIRAFMRFRGGRLLYAYSALATASLPVQQYLTSSPQVLEQLTRLLAPDSSIRISGTGWDPEMLRIIHLLAADDQGLYLPLDERFGPYLFPDGKSASGAQAGGIPRLRVRLEDLAAFGREQKGRAPAAGAGTLELLKYVQEVRPHMLTGESIAALMRNPSESAVYFDLIWDVDPPVDILVKYLNYCSEIAREGNKGWNENRTRTSQSIFYLLNALCRERAISREAAAGLVQAALSAFSAADEPEFLLNLTGFLTDRMLPQAAAPDGSPLERLAGRAPPQAFLFEGNPIAYDPPAERLQRMKSAVKEQRVITIPQLLDTIRAGLRILPGQETSREAFLALAEKLAKLPVPEAAPGKLPSGDRAGTVGKVIFQDLALQLGSPMAPTNRTFVTERLPNLMRQLIGALHAELGVALLASCYAYDGTPRTAALMYDPEFVRKHRFYSGTRTAGWMPAGLEQVSQRESTVSGALSGLAAQLSVAEIQASAHTAGKQDPNSVDWSGAIPAMLSGMRETPQFLRTERAREYVALAVRLGRELLALQVLDPQSAGWTDWYVSTLLSPLRREQFERRLGRGSFAEAAAILSPSELFLLGQAYLAALGVLRPSACARLIANQGGLQHRIQVPPSFANPAIDRLRQIIPREGSDSLEQFQSEVEQYGSYLWRRLGLTENSLRFAEPHEQVQNCTWDVAVERIFDLKIRLAEIGYAAGLPASIEGMLGEMAIQSLFTDAGAAHLSGWEEVIGLISRLGIGTAHGWVEELLISGALTLRAGMQDDEP